MSTIIALQQALASFSGMSAEGFELSAAHWQEKRYGKGEFYNEYKNVCKHLGFVIDGIFRSYYIDPESAEEKNVFFFSPGQVIVAYKSFVTQTPCNYYTQSLTEATILYISYEQLMALYKQSHEWERLGRLIAEVAFNLAMTKAENFMFMTPEQRYIQLTEEHPDIFNSVPLYHIASYLGIQGPSLSRIRKRMMAK